MYDVGLWSVYNCGTLSMLKSAYHRCIKLFFGYARQFSVTQILLELVYGQKTTGHKTTGQKTTKNANRGQKTTRTKDHPDKKPPSSKFCVFYLMKFIINFARPKNGDNTHQHKPTCLLLSIDLTIIPA